MGIFHIEYLSCEELIPWQSIFLHLSTSLYSIDPAQLLHVVVKQASKLYLDLLGHKPKDRFLLYAAYLPVFTV